MKADLVHGGALDRMRLAFPFAPQPWIDLSTGINPWAYPVEDIPVKVFHHLPTQKAYDACRMAMAESIRAPAESLVMAPGSEFLIRLLPMLIRPKKVAILSPTYGDHVDAWRRAGSEVVETTDPLRMADQFESVVICNPNNPDGRLFAPEILLQVATSLSRRGGWLIVDEAYADLDAECSMTPYGGMGGLIVLRSFGKFFGLAGLRLGAFIAPEAVRVDMQNLLGAWPVSGPALAIGARACRDFAWQAETRQRLRDARERLDRLLQLSGLNVCGGTDLFRIVATDDAHTLWKTLAQRGIYVRRFSWSDKLVRIGLPGNEVAEDRLLAALKT
ncbi:threonine-phosphate decarboxylase CobD [Hyphomonas sp. WL0036]|uniref:threonine-phosphate decarboxylase CobD n=1 Tax=Hyphomonas sediminis TaxID=2866160 RepID=UPI001C7F76FD|nr:threonine-phosphate decarboxylase CobD [Hyphomonas sediminis]MBY9068180.1 threonine-phosphate decarboxylase CobD [Hyphomonas sediminis]